MARQKSTPLRREVSSEYTSKADRTPRHLDRGDDTMAKNVTLNGHANGKVVARDGSAEKKQAGLPQLIIAVGGIYASFLTWALLQERLTTTPYGANNEFFTFPVFLNTIQSLFAATTGYIYLLLSKQASSPTPAIFPSTRILIPLFLVSLTFSLASPFGYASLAHIDYITFILAKSCKLLPVMFLHITLFRRSFPIYKYLVVLSVTLGVAIFTLHASSSKKHRAADQSVVKNHAWGLLLLAINLLLDGLTNTTQDWIFTAFKSYTGPQMMCANNLLGTAITISWLLLSPYIAQTGLGEYLGMDLASGSGSGEFSAALTFLKTYPSVWRDVLGFAACGAIGQVFIFYTLSQFSSVLLVTVTVTRKMITMILSVVWFGHRLSGMQWLGVGLVFGGVGAEGWVQRREKMAKAKAGKAMGMKELLEEEIREAAREKGEVEGKKEL